MEKKSLIQMDRTDDALGSILSASLFCTVAIGAKIIFYKFQVNAAVR